MTSPFQRASDKDLGRSFRKSSEHLAAYAASFPVGEEGYLLHHAIVANAVGLIANVFEECLPPKLLDRPARYDAVIEDFHSKLETFWEEHMQSVEEAVRTAKRDARVVLHLSKRQRDAMTLCAHLHKLGIKAKQSRRGPVFEVSVAAADAEVAIVCRDSWLRLSDGARLEPLKRILA